MKKWSNVEEMEASIRERMQYYAMMERTIAAHQVSGYVEKKNLFVGVGQPSQTSLTEVNMDDDYDEDEDITRGLQDEIDYYLSELLSATADELDVGLLPSFHNKRFNSIIMGLRVGIDSAIYSAERTYLSMIKECSEEDFEIVTEMYHDEVSPLNKKKAFLEDSLQIVEKIVEKGDILNTLIFLPAGNDSTRASEDINNDFSVEYYKRILDLLKSIEEGTFLGVRKIKGYDSNLSEVRAFKVRILFKRIPKSNYFVIVKIFKKQEDTSGYHSKILKTADRNYRNYEQKIRESLANPDYISLNMNVRDGLYSELSGGGYFDKTRNSGKS